MHARLRINKSELSGRYFKPMLIRPYTTLLPPVVVEEPNSCLTGTTISRGLHHPHSMEEVPLVSLSGVLGISRKEVEDGECS